NIAFSIIIGLLVFVSAGAIVKAAGRIMGAVFFGVIYAVVAVVLQTTSMDVIALAFTIGYGAVIGFAVAFIAPPTQKAIGVK
ncbi:MAG: hypothetical protein AAB922_04120, partial [Patescibacteria group bacterium]